MMEIRIHVPTDKLESRVYRLVQDEHGQRTEEPIGVPAAIDEASFGPGKSLDPAKLRLLLAKNVANTEFPKSGRELMEAMGVAALWLQLQQEHQDQLRTYLHVEHPLLRDIPWELLTNNVDPVFSSVPWTRVLKWPLDQAANDSIWPIRVLVINATDPDDKNIAAEQEVWGIRSGLRAAELWFDLEVLRTGIDPTFDVSKLEDLMTRMEDGVRKWPGGPHVLHFIGHSVAGELRLFVPRAAGPGSYIPWTRAQIAAIFNRLTELRFVYLNACRTNQPNNDPMAPTSAAQVFLNRARAVIAMQADVRGEAAALCSGEFYRSLASGGNPDVALQSARSKLLVKYNENSPNMYTPVMTARVAGDQVLQRKCFHHWTPADDKVWQDALRSAAADNRKDNWGHFVDQRPRRRDLATALLGPNPSAPLVVHGEKDVGKTWLLRWIAYVLALNGMKTLYVEAGPAMDWLEVLRRIRDGSTRPYSPGLSEPQRNEFNWKLNHLAVGKTPLGPAPPGVKDTAGTLNQITNNGQVDNGFESLFCDPMALALRTDAATQPLALVLDDLTRPNLKVLKQNLLDQLARVSNIRIILCLDETIYANPQDVTFAGWGEIGITEVDVPLARDLAREILRLKFPGKDTSELEDFVIGILEKRKLVALPIGTLYNGCESAADLIGLK